ncbi:MAG: hypothetical protein GY839_17485 [candidate division Zixibacteria bacterium]|nr:hypothetical protein [candidate division Zixibacteria bacterium]
MRAKLVVLIIAILMTVTIRAETYRQIKVFTTDIEIIKQLSIFEITGFETGKYVEIVADDLAFEKIKNLGLPIEIVHEDLTAFYQSRYPIGTTMGGFRVYSEVVALLDSMSNDYPSIVTSKTSIGQTEEGRDLWLVKISDNPNVDEDEPEIFINAMHHAREPVTVETCAEFIKTLAEGYGIDPEITGLVNNNEFYILPIVNPDGYEYNRQSYPSGGGMWRKNRRDNGDGNYGVDLNRNYTKFWGYDGSGSSGETYSSTYRGPSPASEPEIQAMMNFISSRDFAWVNNYHAYGNLLIWPWGYNGVSNEDVSLYWELFGNYAEDTLGYDPGTAWETIFYNANGNATDWGYGEERSKKKTYAMCIEIGNSSDNFWPPVERIPVLVEENISVMLNYSHKAYEIYKRRDPQVPEIISPLAAPIGQQFYLNWSTDEPDTFNSAISYRVIEKSDYQIITQDCESGADFDLSSFTMSADREHSGNYSLYSGQGDNHTSTAILKERLLVKPGDTLTFWTWYEIESDWDYAYVEVSTDGVAWWPLNGNLSTDYDPNNHNEGYGITGNSGGWTLAKYYINDYVGQQVDIRFRYWTDSNTIEEGIYIDDIYPCESFQSTQELAEYVYQDSLLVGPYAPGIYYFQVSALDDRGDRSALSDRFGVDVTSQSYTLTGYVGLSDSPVNLDGTIVTIIGSGLSDSTDISGQYSIPNIAAGTYDIIASHNGYDDSTFVEFTISSDTSLDMFLERILQVEPTLIEPEDSVELDTSYVWFEWTHVDYATGYLFELAIDDQFSNIVDLDSNIASTTYGSDSLADNWYWWRVKATNGYSWTEYSASWCFQVAFDTSSVDFLPGDANGDGLVIGSDVTYLVAYFRGANPPPDPFLAGDANGDCAVIGSDVTYLVNYFRGEGQPPVRGDCFALINNSGSSAEDFSNE